MIPQLLEQLHELYEAFAQPIDTSYSKHLVSNTQAYHIKDDRHCKPYICVLTPNDYSSSYHWNIIMYFVKPKAYRHVKERSNMQCSHTVHHAINIYTNINNFTGRHIIFIDIHMNINWYT